MKIDLEKNNYKHLLSFRKKLKRLHCEDHLPHRVEENLHNFPDKTEKSKKRLSVPALGTPDVNHRYQLR